MSKYTTELRYLCEVESGATESHGFNSINDILTTSAPKIFNFDFPIFDENYRLPLEIKILRHYYTREISEETVGLWKLRLQDKLNMIMPYYNKLYSSELIQFNPLYDVDLTREKTIVNEGENSNEETGNTFSNENSFANKVQNAEYERNNNSNSNSATFRNSSSANNSETSETNTSSSTSSGETDTTSTINDTKKDKYSDTPQGSISNLESDTYLTNARITTENATNTDNTEMSNRAAESGSSTSSVNENSVANGSENNSVEKIDKNTETSTLSDSETKTKNNSVNVNKSNVESITNTQDYTEHVLGKQGTSSNSKMLKEFRETFINIDKMVIEELSTLFFGLW